MTNPNTTDDIDEFEERWLNWSDDLKRLRFSAYSQDHADTVEELREELRRVITEIADEKRATDDTDTDT